MPVLVTLLVDCSGSMGTHAEPVAVPVDVLARALERAGAGCEVLGFTTAAWHGGRSRRDWLRAGRPPNPGRLAEVRHADGATNSASGDRVRRTTNSPPARNGRRCAGPRSK